MSATDRPLLLIPGDDPIQIAGSPRLETLGEHFEVRLFDNRPTDDAEKLERASAATAMIHLRFTRVQPEPSLGPAEPRFVFGHRLAPSAALALLARSLQ